MTFANVGACHPVLVAAPGRAHIGDAVSEGYQPAANQRLTFIGKQYVACSQGHSVPLNMYRVDAAAVIMATPVAAPIYVAPQQLYVAPPAASQIDRNGHVVVGSANAPQRNPNYMPGHSVSYSVNGGNNHVRRPGGL